MSNMRAKFQVNRIEQFSQSETIHFNAVGKSNGYPEDGSDEDNNYAKWSPQAECKINITNPALIGTFAVGEKYYVDFTKADA